MYYHKYYHNSIIYLMVLTISLAPFEICCSPKNGRLSRRDVFDRDQIQSAPSYLRYLVVLFSHHYVH